MGPLPLIAGLFAASSAPIWHPLNTSAHFVYFRSPPFVLPAPSTSLNSTPLLITATASPNVGAHGTTQSKLFGGFVLYVNGVLTTSGPGHAIPDLSQPLRSLDLLPLHLLRDPPQTNVLAVRCFFQNTWVGKTDPSAVPRLQALLTAVPAGGGGGGEGITLVSTGPTWTTLNADPYHNPAGDPPLKAGWYHVPNENLNVAERPLGWESPQFDDSQWTPAVTQPQYTLPIIPAAPSTSPTFLTRTACSVTRLASGATLIDYGQEFLGGVNLTFADPPTQTSFLVQLGEELTADGEVMVPCRSSVNYTAQWTLVAGGGNGEGAGGLNTGLHTHEFTQFRFAQLSVGAPTLLAANAWVVTAPRGGDGVNPYEIPCAKSTPITPGRESNPATSAHASFSSSSPNLDAVWRLCAYSMVATALDINVDSQTRQRDLCHVDAYITNAGQAAVFPARDTSVVTRTARAAFQVSSSLLPSSYDFKASTVLLAGVAAREVGDVALLSTVWGEDVFSGNSSIYALQGGNYLSAQFLSGLWYFNASVGGLDIPLDCGSPLWGCDPLIDWPTQTRDGYSVSTVDALRNSFGAAALRTLSYAASALGNTTASQKYATLSHTISTTLATHFLRWNTTSSAEAEAYFVDGLSGPSSKHAAIHSTLYAVALGGALGAWVPPPNATTLTLASALTTYLIRRGGYGPASCMTAKAALEALYTLGVHDGRAADFALELLTREGYPGWVDMIHNNATVTLEAWAWGDKWNTDAGHPWCASPSFLIPGGLFGVRPGEAMGVEGGGWKAWSITPQPGNLSSVNVTLPTWVGEIAGEFVQGGGGMGGVTLRVTIPAGSTADVCLPPLHPSFLTEGRKGGVSGDTLTVNGVSVPSKVVGRLLCAVDPLMGAGVPYVVVRS